MIKPRLLNVALLFLYGISFLEAGTFYDLRLDNALISENSKNRDWVLSPMIRFTVQGGKVVRPVIELKRGWVVPSWKGVVQSLEVLEASKKNLKLKASAKINSSIGVRGSYGFQIEVNLVNGQATGKHTSRHVSGEVREDDVRGTFEEIEDVCLDSGNAVWTIQLVKGLPKGETLTVYLTTKQGKVATAFAFSPNITRRPIDVDTSGLKLDGNLLNGKLVANRLNTREPDGGERSTFGVYKMEAEHTDSLISGSFSGSTVDNAPVHGEIWGEVRPIQKLPNSLTIFLKLEDGYAGGAMWQNRVFFKANMEGGKLKDGTADNNKNVFNADLTGADLLITESHINGTIQSTVHSSGSVHKGKYQFRIKGLRAGDLLQGRFYTYYQDKEDHSGYFIGSILR